MHWSNSRSKEKRKSCQFMRFEGAFRLQQTIQTKNEISNFSEEEGETQRYVRRCGTYLQRSMGVMWICSRCMGIIHHCSSGHFPRSTPQSTSFQSEGSLCGTSSSCAVIGRNKSWERQIQQSRRVGEDAWRGEDPPPQSVVKESIRNRHDFCRYKQPLGEL